MSDSESKISLDSQAMKHLANIEKIEDQINERADKLDTRLKTVEDRTAPPAPWAKLRQQWLGILIVLLWGIVQSLTYHLYVSEKAHVYEAIDSKHEAALHLIETRSRDRFYLSDGLEILNCDADISAGLFQHLEDHEVFNRGFPTRPGLKDQAENCQKTSEEHARRLRQRLSQP